jgi:hypothetical protein
MNNQDRNRDALIAHIQAQDTIIRTRNNEIAELQSKLADVLNNPFDITAAIEKRCQSFYKAGWKAAHKALVAEARQQWLNMSHLSEPPKEAK